MPTWRSRPVTTKSRLGSIWPLADASKSGIRLFAVMVGCGSMPPASQKVGARSMRLTKSSTTRPGSMRPRPARGQRHLAADVVEIALRAGHPGDAVIAAHHDEGVVELAGGFELGEQDAEAQVHRQALAEIVGGILADVVYVREEVRQAALEVVGLDVPKRLAGTALPGAMGVGGAPPVAKRRVRRAGAQEGAEVVAGLAEHRLLGTLDAELACMRGYPMRELVEVAAGGLEASAQGANGRVGGAAWAPHLVLVADEIAGLGLELQREGGNGLVPHRSLQNRAEPRLPEVAPREDGTAAGRAGRCRHQGVGEERALGGDAVEVGRFDQVAERIRPFAGAAAATAVGARIAAPIVGKGKQNVGLVLHRVHPLSSSDRRSMRAAFTREM